MKHFKLFTLTMLVALVSSITASAENYILYTSSDDKVVEPYNPYYEFFGANIVANTYENGQGKILFDGEVTSIGSEAFYKCTSLTSVVIPNSVTSIGECAFRTCSCLTSIVIGNSVTTIGDGAFEDCPNLPVENNIRYADTYLVEAVDKTLSTYAIKEETKWIGDYAFKNCSNLTSVELPNSVISIGSYAFFGCTDLSSVAIPSSLTTIGSYAFSNCRNLAAVNISDLGAWCEINFVEKNSNPLYCAHKLYLNGELVTDLDIPNSVTKIGKYAFNAYSSLKSVEIPNSVTSIGESAFSSSGLESVELGNSVTEIGDNAFYRCNSLRSLEMGHSVTTIGESTFYGCSNLTSVEIPNSVTGIGKYAFQSCYRLESVVIGKSVSSIGNYAFADCASLNGIVSLNTTPPNVDEYTTFRSEIQSSCKVLVPESAVDAYREAKGWKDFANIAAFSTDLIDGVEYTYNFDLKNCDVTYSRTFAKDNWQALFLPFAMQYNDWNDKGTVAELTGVSDGVLEWTILEEGSATVAGKPYIFKPNATGGMKFSVEGTTLVSNKTIVPVEISGYELSGTYTEKADMAAILGYTLSGKNFYCITDETKKLKPYRIFLTVPSPSLEPIHLRINGEEATVIDNLITAPSKGEDVRYNLCGQKVSEGYNGIVIVNGRKVTRK